MGTNAGLGIPGVEVGVVVEVALARGGWILAEEPLRASLISFGRYPSALIGICGGLSNLESINSGSNSGLASAFW